MAKIRVLPDQVANQIAAGEVVERPSSVAKELVENAIDAGARRIVIDFEAGGRKLLRVMDDGEGMTRDDAMLAFERHATSKISRSEDLLAIRTLGFRGEALASIASVARVELVTKSDEEPNATRVTIEGGRLRDVQAAAHPRGTTVVVRDLFFNVPARRKFLRSEATESFHLTNLITHYALAHPEISWTLTNNGRETLRAAVARDLRERAYQIFGADFLDSLLEVSGGHEQIARVYGFVSAPRERRTSRDAQFLFVNGRYVRDRLIARALTEGYRAVLPYGAYPAALLFLEVPLEEVDVNVHPTKIEVRFRRAAAVADAVTLAVRAALGGAGYARQTGSGPGAQAYRAFNRDSAAPRAEGAHAGPRHNAAREAIAALYDPSAAPAFDAGAPAREEQPQQQGIDFGLTPSDEGATIRANEPDAAPGPLARGDQRAAPPTGVQTDEAAGAETWTPPDEEARPAALPPLVSASSLVRQITVEALSTNIRPLGQLEESFIIATDDEGLLLIDQHLAHERILFDKYRAIESARPAESQQLLMPETLDLTPAQAAVFDSMATELETYGFSLMRLSGRTIAIKAVPADLPEALARNILVEVLATVDTVRRDAARADLHDRIAATLACRAAIKAGTPLSPEKMRWLIDGLLKTSSSTTSPHGRPIILRLTTRDIEKGFHRG
jgi:DNA mismatch repair protein MutL